MFHTAAVRANIHIRIIRTIGIICDCCGRVCGNGHFGWLSEWRYIRVVDAVDVVVTTTTTATIEVISNLTIPMVAVLIAVTHACLRSIECRIMIIGSYNNEQ